MDLNSVMTTTDGGGSTGGNIVYLPSLTCGCYGVCSCSWQHIGYWHVQSEPQSCIGKAHVFECEHVNACKCGAIKRVMPRAKKTR